mgnify:CR=1 FL=1
MIVYGTRHYGKVDRLGLDASGGPYVATRFAHIYFLPLIPLGSTLVVAETGKGVEGLQLPLSGKSVGFAYLRCWGLLGVLVLGVVGALAAQHLLQGGLHETVVTGYQVNALGVQEPVFGIGGFRWGQIAAALAGFGGAAALILLRLFGDRFAAPGPERRRELEAMLGRTTATPSLPVPQAQHSASRDYHRVPAAPGVPRDLAVNAPAPEHAIETGRAAPSSGIDPRRP